MARIVTCHQRIVRNSKTCADNSQSLICYLQMMIMTTSSVSVFLFLKATNVRVAVLSAFFFSFNSLILLFVYVNGQRIFNQNDKLRESLLEIPWVDKPRWLRQTMHIMLTQTNRDIQIKPYGIFTLNYMSYKDLMKFTFSIGNVLYRREQLVNQSQ
ncbi:uncharacterized protein LOC120353067 isoform X2 [Nilaparvata lugens]|uniref:uncharacterized protein LOC120353067 isoform X2 n=1 Tax=Nilaparvata lugens TaxID=108931 RepID=UPI00193E6667|nr:uncharacterized protein LOC120353067 isoform X2 [Nilaparvata lugens]